ncbi:MAG: tetratricopeptide repeat protein [Pseudobdellovibrionaceae bacterium]|nr:tetratricopeptide repeat protein [Bdellovibrionales bacterium]USN49034.1 MAG: tetratricopeptide repeat protein [Pseudobdellovibrionaceae bacterium]
MSKLEQAAKGYYQQKQFTGYLKSLNLLLRMYAEMENHEAIDDTKERLQDLVLKEKVKLNAKSFYTLGLCASYKQQYKTALEYLEKSLAQALADDNKEDICYAINGLALVYTLLGRYDDALKEIYNLQVFFQVLPVPDLELSSQMLNGHILRKMGKYDQALEVFWRCYDQLKSQKNLYMYILLLDAMGTTFHEMGDNDMARMYMNLARRTADPENLRYFTRNLEAKIEKLGGVHDESKYDLVFHASTNSVVEKKRGRIDFKNQFILMDMLRLFLQHPGSVYSKESLVKQVWRQEYDPQVHDNKIYVTIKRLRKMIEPDFDKPKYIFRAKNGYYLSKDTRVLID